MTEKSNVTISHFGICVSDLEHSTRFYTEALGFTHSHTVNFEEPFDTLIELPGLKGYASFFMHGDVMVELISYDTPKVVGPASRRPMNQLGITHLALIVDKLEVLAQAITKFGGTVLDETRIDAPMGSMMFATDPDGTRLELWEKKD